MTADTEDLAKRLEDERHVMQGDGLGPLLETCREAAASLRSKDEEIAAKDARIKELEGALTGIKALKPTPIGDTGFAVGPASLLRRAQEIANDTLKPKRARSTLTETDHG